MQHEFIYCGFGMVVGCWVLEVTVGSSQMPNALITVTTDLKSSNNKYSVVTNKFTDNTVKNAINNNFQL